MIEEDGQAIIGSLIFKPHLHDLIYFRVKEHFESLGWIVKSNGFDCDGIWLKVFSKEKYREYLKERSIIGFTIAATILIFAGLIAYF